MNNKGFLFASLTFLLVLSVFMLAVFFAMQKFPIDMSAEKTRNIFDDIKTDIEDLLQLRAYVIRSGSTTVSFQDHIPFENGVIVMNRYKNFVEGNYSAEANSNITLSVLNSNFIIEPFGIIYGYPDFNKNEIRVYNGSGDDAVGVQEYIVNLYFDEDLHNMTNYSIPGDLKVTLSATFANSNYNETIFIDRSGNTTWTFNLGDSNVTVRVGKNNVGGLLKNSSLIINPENGVEGDITTGLVLGHTNETAGVKSGIYLGVIDKIIREDYIWLVKS